MHNIEQERNKVLHHGEYCMNFSAIEQHQLSKIADIQPGYPFRGKLPLADSGEAYVVQFRHIVSNQVNDGLGKTLDRVNLTGRKKANFLQPGDVIFMAKGTRNLAAVIQDIPENTVCTPNFYHIRLTVGASDLEPYFLAWQLNHSDAQRYFATCSQGSASTSITKTQLENLPVSIPGREEQNYIVRLAQAAAHEQEVLMQLIDNRRRMIDGIGQQILHQKQGKA